MTRYPSIIAPPVQVAGSLADTALVAVEAGVMWAATLMTFALSFFWALAFLLDISQARRLPLDEAVAYKNLLA